MSKYITVLVYVLTVAVLGLGAYSVVTIGSLKSDMKDAKADSRDNIATIRDYSGREMRQISAAVQGVQADIDDLKDKANAQEKQANLAAESKRAVERDIKRNRLVNLQKYFQVSDWKVSCVVATSNSLNCLGEGFLDGDESKESYEATVDKDGTFVWKQSY